MPQNFVLLLIQIDIMIFSVEVQQILDYLIFMVVNLDLQDMFLAE